MRWLGRIALLVALWLLAWGDASLANVVTGVLVATALLIGFPPDPDRHRAAVRPLPALRLVGYVAGQLITSNVEMTRRTFRRRPDLQPGVITHRLTDGSDPVVTTMSSVIALSPGTMVVDVSDDGSTLYVHFLRLDDVEAARASLRRLEEIVERALPRTSADPEPEPVPEEQP